MHVQMPNRVLREHVEAKEEIIRRDQVREGGFRGLETIEDIIADFFVHRAAGGIGREELAVLVVHGESCARENGGFAPARVPEVGEMVLHFVEKEAGVRCRGGIDDVIDAGFRDDEAVAKALAFRPFSWDCFRILTAVIRGNVSDDIRMLGFA